MNDTKRRKTTTKGMGEELSLSLKKGDGGKDMLKRQQKLCASSSSSFLYVNFPQSTLSMYSSVCANNPSKVFSTICTLHDKDKRNVPTLFYNIFSLLTIDHHPWVE